MTVLHRLALLALLLLPGCALFHGDSASDLSSLTPESVLRRIEANNQRISTLTGRGRLIIEIPDTPFSGEVIIRVIRPDSLYIATEAAFGVDVGFLFADGKSFHSYSPIDNLYLIGPVNRLGSLVLFNLEIAYTDLLNSVMGAASFPLQPDTKMVLRDDRFYFSQPFQGQKLLYEVDAGRFVITKIQLFDAAGRETFRQEFRRFRKIKGIWVPRHIQLTRPPTRERLTVWYSRVDLNRPLAPQLFTYKVPANARVEHLRQ